MTTYAESTDIRRLLGRIARRSDVDPATADNEHLPGPWRVVAADSSGSVFDPPSEEPALDGTSLDETSSDGSADRPSSASLHSAASLHHAAMPVAVADCSELLQATAGLIDAGGVLQQAEAISRPKPGAIAVVSSSNGCSCPSGISSRSMAPARSKPAQSVLPPQATPSCREIDSELARIIDRWSDLPRSIRAAITAMIETDHDDR